MKTKIILYFLMCFPLTSCAAIPQKIKDAFTYCFDNSNTGVDTLLNLDGYYCVTTITKRYWNNSIDTSYNHYMFYDNGLFTFNFDDYNNKRHHNDNSKKNVPLYFKEILENVKTEGRKEFYGNDWGRYIISGDTIKMQYWHKKDGIFDYWYAYECWGIIKDRKISQGIKSFFITSDEKEKEYDKLNEIRKVSNPSNKSEESTEVFVPVQVKPSSDECWLLKEKWFWCNEQDWKNYMEKIKEKKKK